MNDGFDDDGPAAWLHDAFGDEVATLAIDPTPLAAVMRNGAALRTRRRLTLASGVTALVVLPVVAVAVFGTGSGAGTRRGPSISSATHTPTRSSAPLPAPIAASTPLAAPGQANPDYPDDSIVVLASGTFEGQHWRLVRDRYVVAGPEPADVMGDPSSRPHLPYATHWGKSGTIECDFTGIQWGDKAPGARPDFSAGGGCNPTDDGSVAALHGRFAGASSGGGPEHGAKPALLLTGRLDGADAASMTLGLDGWVSAKLPLIVVPGEQNDYFVIMLPTLPNPTATSAELTVYDAAGHSLGSMNFPFGRR